MNGSDAKRQLPLISIIPLVAMIPILFMPALIYGTSTIAKVIAPFWLNPIALGIVLISGCVPWVRRRPAVLFLFIGLSSVGLALEWHRISSQVHEVYGSSRYIGIGWYLFTVCFAVWCFIVVVFAFMRFPAIQVLKRVVPCLLIGPMLYLLYQVTLPLMVDNDTLARRTIFESTRFYAIAAVPDERKSIRWLNDNMVKRWVKHVQMKGEWKSYSKWMAKVAQESNDDNVRSLALLTLIHINGLKDHFDVFVDRPIPPALAWHFSLALVNMVHSVEPPQAQKLADAIPLNSLKYYEASFILRHEESLEESFIILWPLYDARAKNFIREVLREEGRVELLNRLL